MKKMKIFNISLVLLILISTPCYSSQDTLVPWSYVSIEAPESNRNIKVVAKSNGDTLQLLSMTIDGITLSVPPSEFQDIPQIHLNSIMLLSGMFINLPELSGVPYQYVRLEFGKGDYFNGIWEANTVDFLFYSGKYQRRTVRRHVAPGSWKYEEKIPGKTSGLMGAERRIR